MKWNMSMTFPSSIVNSLQGRATELMPAVTMTNTELLINDFLYLVPVTISLPDRRSYPTVYLKKYRSIYAKAVIQFIASNSQMYNLQTELTSRVIDSLVKVTLALFFFVFFFSFSM